MGRQDQIAVENDRAMRLSAAMLRADTGPGEASSVSLSVRLTRSVKGTSTFMVRAGSVEGRAPTLAGALLNALDQAGVN